MYSIVFSTFWKKGIIIQDNKDQKSSDGANFLQISFSYQLEW